MCKEIGRIITVNQANAEEELKAHNNPPSFYCYYWRTHTGELRKTGYVHICKCGQFQFWSKNKKDK